MTDVELHPTLKLKSSHRNCYHSESISKLNFWSGTFPAFKTMSQLVSRPLEGAQKMPQQLKHLLFKQEVWSPVPQNPSKGQIGAQWFVYNSVM